MHFKDSSHGWRAWAPVSVLAIAAFVFNTSEFLPVGLLPDMAAGLGESLSYMGLIITGYAWIVALTSLPMALLTARFERKKLLLTLMTFFALAHIVVLWVNSFETLLASRVIVALTHAVFWSIMAPLAARLAPNGHRAKGLAAVMAGTVLATILGVPIGTKLGHWFGWQEAFAVIGIATIISGLLIAWAVPTSPSRQAGSLASLPIIMKRPALIQLYTLAVLATLGHFMVYSYVSPIVTEVMGMTADDVISLLLVFGIAGFLGTIIISKLVDKHPSLALILPMLFIGTALALLLPTSDIAPIRWALVLFWGMGITSLIMVMNALVLQVAHDATDIATSLMSGIINVGIGGGAFLGSILSVQFGFVSLPYAGAGLAASALAICAVVFLKTGETILPYEKAPDRY